MDRASEGEREGVVRRGGQESVWRQAMMDRLPSNQNYHKGSSHTWPRTAVPRVMQHVTLLGVLGAKHF